MNELDRSGAFYALKERFKEKIAVYRTQADDFAELFAQHIVFSYQSSVN